MIKFIYTNLVIKFKLENIFMSVIIKFTNNTTENELLLIEIQGSITHTIESKFNYMFLGKLKKINDVLIS